MQKSYNLKIERQLWIDIMGAFQSQKTAGVPEHTPKALYTTWGARL